MSTALVVSGSGHWADPWHPFATTSRRLAELIGAHGVAVEVRDDVEDALVELGGVSSGGIDLLVLNVGNPDGPAPDVPAVELGEPPSLPVVEAVLAGVHAHLERGGALLAMHSSSTPLSSFASWSRALGGHWVRGRSDHPPIGPAQIELTGTEHPVSAGLGDFTLVDERYSWLHTEHDITVLAEHHHAGERHPLVWARTDAPVVYDALGHDERSYDSPDHRRLLDQAVTWLLR